MKLLFAAADRDLLRSYGELLTADGVEVVTAFDGTHVLALMEEQTFDVVVLDRDIPRVDHRRIVRRLKERGIPVILLLNGRDGMRAEQSDIRADVSISHPFLHYELMALVQAIAGEGNKVVDNDG